MDLRIASTAGTDPIELNVYDSGGTGRPVVLIHGWPLNGHSWKPQKSVLEAAGHRVIAFDRRGFGESDKPIGGYDYDTMAGDVDAIMNHLELEDAVLVGFSMGGGEVARYVGRFGTDRLAALVFASAVPPFLQKTADNTDGGLGDEDIEGMKKQLMADREAFFGDFAENFYTANGTVTVDTAVLDTWKERASQADLNAAVSCIDAFSRTDFRDDLAEIDIPTLVIHGGADEIVPPEVSGKRTADTVADAKLVMIDGGPHGVLDSHTDEFNSALLDFLGAI